MTDRKPIQDSVLVRTLATTVVILCLQPVVSGQQSTSLLSGTVKDISGAVMRSVTVQVFRSEAAEPIREAFTDSEGNFAFGLALGEYRLEISAPAFATAIRTVNVTTDMEKLEVTLDLDIDVQTVTVSADEDPDELLPDASMSLISTRLTGDELLDLPTNEEDLARYLLMLAGADTTGDLEEDVLANFIIDGFDDGRLPSPDQIAQIIIDPNSMSADGSGPRIEIVTNPGTGRWRRSVDFEFADESLNALTPGESEKTSSQTRDLDLRLSGPVIANLLEMDFRFSSRNEDRAGNSLRAVTPTDIYFEGVVRPEVEQDLRIGGEVALNPNHSLDIRFDYTTGRSDHNGVGGFTLPVRGSDRKTNDWRIRLSERAVGNNFTNDFEFQIRHDFDRETPVSEGYAINVADAFRGGGGTNRNVDERTRIQFDNRLRWERDAWNFQLGGEAEFEKTLSIDEDNYNGTFEFSSLHDYCAATGFAGANCQGTLQIVEAAASLGVAPVYLDGNGNEIEITGVPTTFSERSGNPEFEFSEFAFNTFFQADREYGDRASLRLGVRYEATNHSLDYMRFNPMINAQFKPFEETILGFGAELDFQDFGQTERLLRNDGSTYEQELSITSPSFQDPYQGGAIEIDENTTSLYVLDPHYQSPYSINPQVSVNQQLPGNIRVAVSYSVSYGIHQERTRNINAPYPGTPLPDEILDLPLEERREAIDRLRPFYPMVGNIRQIESTGRSVGRNFRIRFQPRSDLRLFGIRLSGDIDYRYRSGDDDNDFNNPYVREWGPTRRQHQIQSRFRIRMPDEPVIENGFLRTMAMATYAGLRLNFDFSANSGGLYSIRSGTDLNGDQSSNDRPPGYGRNTEIGPGRWNLDMTLTKDFFIRRENPNASDTERGGGFGGLAGETRIRLRADFDNLLNHSEPRAYSGVLTSPFFGQPTGYRGGRTIRLSTEIDF